jgi:uncharacterized protein (DUF1015 family)
MAVLSAFKAALPDLTDIVSLDDFFGSAKRKFSFYLNDGLYEQITAPAIFIYRIKRPHRSHTGILACASVQDYIKGHIKKHENTLSSKEEKMAGLIQERNALIKPVLLTYPNVLEIDAFINRYTIGHSPDRIVPFEDEEHWFWQITDEKQLHFIQELFAQQVPDTYICDGHHRCKSCEQLYYSMKDANPMHNGHEPYNFFLSAFFPASEIEIHNYNRLVLSLKGLTPEVFLQKLKEYYQVAPSPRPVTPNFKYELGMIIGKQWYRLQTHSHYIPNNWELPLNECLDAHLLNQYVIQGILGIEDVRTENDIKYIEGPKGTQELEAKVRADKAMVGFNLYPVAMTDLIAVSNQGGTLPPKSTWIEPRMRNGFIAQLYD